MHGIAFSLYLSVDYANKNFSMIFTFSTVVFLRPVDDVRETDRWAYLELLERHWESHSRHIVWRTGRNVVAILPLIELISPRTRSKQTREAIEVDAKHRRLLVVVQSIGPDDNQWSHLSLSIIDQQKSTHVTPLMFDKWSAELNRTEMFSLEHKGPTR